MNRIADWIFFDPTDRRYEYRRKKERKNTTARHSPQRGCDLSSLDSHSSRPSIPRYRQPAHFGQSLRAVREPLKSFIFNFQLSIVILILDNLDIPCAERFQCRALALREAFRTIPSDTDGTTTKSFWTPVLHPAFAVDTAVQNASSVELSLCERHSEPFRPTRTALQPNHFGHPFCIPHLR